MVIAMAAMAFDAQTTDIEALMSHQFVSEPMTLLGVSVPGGGQTLMALAFVLSFASKLPLVPLHAWVQETYARVPAGAAMVMAALCVKIGAYGFIRFMHPVLPEGTTVLAPLLIWLSVATILYAAIAALVQTNIVRLIAYAGVAHMGFVTLGIFSATQQGMDGAIFQMISHGVVMAALMLSAGVLYDRVGSYEIKSFGGMALRMPVFAFGVMIFMLASLGVPVTSGFVGVFLTMVGVFQTQAFVAVIAMLGMVISAAALLSMYKRVIFGPLIKQSLKSLTDLDRRETAIFAALLGMIFYLGLAPGMVTDRTGPSVEAILSAYEPAQAVTEDAE